MPHKLATQEIFREVKTADKEDGVVIVDVGDVVDSHKMFQHDVIPYAVGYWGGNGYGLTDVDWSGRRLLFVPVEEGHDSLWFGGR